MQTFFEDNQKDELIILFCGWGMDEKAFQPHNRNYNILFVFDYNDTDNFRSRIECAMTEKTYKKITLIAFSAGVFMAAYLQDKLPKCDLKIAINGTLKLFDVNLGLPQSSYTMMANINEKNYLELRKKLIYGKKHLAIFNKNQPARTIESSLHELSALKKYYANAKDLKFDYDKVIIGQNDEIIPYSNQFKAWTNHKNKRIIQGGHFLFYYFDSLDEIINL